MSKLNSVTSSMNCLRDLLIDLNDWKAEYELVYSVILFSRQSKDPILNKLDWGGILTLVGELLMERHDSIKNIIFKRTGTSGFQIMIIFKSELMFSGVYYGSLKDLKGKGLSLEHTLHNVLSSIYKNWGDKGDIKLPLIMYS